MLCLDGITAATDASNLFSFLDPIVSQNVPVGCILQLQGDSFGELGENTALLELLASFAVDYTGLVEIILGVPGLGEAVGYFRMRHASDARAQFRRALAPAVGKNHPLLRPKTLATRLPPGDTPVLSGLRSARFQNVILLPDDHSPVEIWKTSADTQQINGGRRISGEFDKETAAKDLSTELANDGPIVVVATFPEGKDLRDADFFDCGAVLGDAISLALNSSECFLTLPSDLRLRSGERFARHLVLCIEAEKSGGISAGLAAKLAQAKLPFTALQASMGNAGNKNNGPTEIAVQKTHGCILVPDNTDPAWKNAKALAFPGQLDSSGIANDAVHCAALKNFTGSGSSQAGLGFEIILDLSDSAATIIGLDEYGALRLPAALRYAEPHTAYSAANLREDIGLSAEDGSDVLIVLRESAIADPFVADAFISAVSALQGTGEFNVIDLQRYFEAVTVNDEPARLLRAAARIKVRSNAEASEEAERRALLDDAKLAWSYFEQLTHNKTGLIPASAWLEGNEVKTYDFATMWDSGTLIQATVSAHSLGLLNESAFNDRISMALSNLADAKHGKLRLPKGLSPTDGGTDGNDAYNASDTARLLLALKVLEKNASKDFGIKDIVARWDLDKTLIDGVPQTVRGGRFVSAYQSNYAGYLARGFNLWDFSVASPYPVPNHVAGMDAEVEFLHAAAQLGPVGTEPHLLEAVELGGLGPSRAVSEALFAAQVEEYLATGKLVCVSEGPINREPWFVYQGYQIGDVAQHWTAETLDPSPRFKTKGFLRAIDMLNTKAAFLWHVVRPGEYTDLLVDRVRKQAKGSSFGFAPGVFSVTGKADQMYSDANTNGIILQAIAYRLNARTPAISWRTPGPIKE